MAKLKKLPQTAVIKILEGNGFCKMRSAKHITFKKFLSKGEVLTTWVPHHREVTIFFTIYYQANWQAARRI